MRHSLNTLLLKLMLVLFIVKETLESPLDITSVKARNELLKCKYGTFDFCLCIHARP